MKTLDPLIPRASIPSHVYDVTCGKCNKTKMETQARTMTLAERELRVQGWKKTEKHGWVCDVCRCAKEQKSVVGLFEGEPQ